MNDPRALASKLRRKREKTIFYSDTVQTNQKTMWTHNFSVEKIDFSVSNVWSNDTCPIIREKREMSKMPLTHEQIHVILAIKQIKHWKLIKEIPCVMYWMLFENVCCKSKSYKEKGGFHLHLLVFPFIYQFNTRIGVLVRSCKWLVQKDFNNISQSFHSLIVEVVTWKRM